MEYLCLGSRDRYPWSNRAHLGQANRASSPRLELVKKRVAGAGQGEVREGHTHCNLHSGDRISENMPPPPLGSPFGRHRPPIMELPPLMSPISQITKQTLESVMRKDMETLSDG